MEGSGTREAPRELASLLPALPVEKRFAAPASPAGIVGSVGTAVSFFRTVPLVKAAGVQAGAAVQLQSLATQGTCHPGILP